MSWSLQLYFQQQDFMLNVAMRGDSSPIALIGPNGAGKTTLLRLIAGAHTPGHGHITIHDQTVYDAKRSIALSPEDRDVGYVPQGYGLFPHLNVLDNVSFGWLARSPRPSRSARNDAAMAMLARLDCHGLAHRDVCSLSGGEQQRIALARALLAEPKLLLLDEPLAALDITVRQNLRNFLAMQLHAQPTLLVTHDPQDLHALCSYVYVLEHGRIVQSGTPSELIAKPTTAFVEAFFATTSINRSNKE